MMNKKIYTFLLICLFVVYSMLYADTLKNRAIRWDCRYRYIMGNFAWWPVLEEYKKLGLAWYSSNEVMLSWQQCQPKPSWQGGKVEWNNDQWLQKMKDWKRNGIESQFLFGMEPVWIGFSSWHYYIFHDPVTESIYKYWDTESFGPAPEDKTWTMLDEWEYWVKGIVSWVKANGDFVDIWLVWSEPCGRGLKSQNAGIILKKTHDVIKMIDPDAYITTQGVGGRRLNISREILANGGNCMYTTSYHTWDVNMPESYYLSDRNDPSNRFLWYEWYFYVQRKGYGSGFKESTESFLVQAKRWGVKDPVDGRTKLIIPEFGVAQIMNEPDIRVRNKPQTRWQYDNVKWRDRQAYYWTRTMILALSTGAVAKIMSIQPQNPEFFSDNIWIYYQPSYLASEIHRNVEPDFLKYLKRSAEPKELPMKVTKRIGETGFPYNFIHNKIMQSKRLKDEIVDYENKLTDFFSYRRNDLRRPVYYSALLMISIMADAFCISRVHLSENLYGYHFRTDRPIDSIIPTKNKGDINLNKPADTMITVLWDPLGESEVMLRSPENELVFFKRIQRIKSDLTSPEIETGIINIKERKFKIKINKVPVFILGEVYQNDIFNVSTIKKAKKLKINERDIINIYFKTGTELSVGDLKILIPKGWTPPQVKDINKKGYITVEPGKFVKIGKISIDGYTISIPVKRMKLSEHINIYYGDTIKNSDTIDKPNAFFFDMGDNSTGPISMKYVKIDGNMIYNDRCGDGFNHKGVWNFPDPPGNKWDSLSGIPLIDNEITDIRRDMALSCDFKSEKQLDSWRFITKTKSNYEYQVRIYLNGKGKLDDMLSDQTVSISGSNRLFISNSDILIHNVKPEDKNKIIVKLHPDNENSLKQIFCRNDIVDDLAVSYIMGLDIIPEELCASASEDAIKGKNIFILKKIKNRKETSLKSSIFIE